jgi:hypothetical protein
MTFFRQYQDKATYEEISEETVRTVLQRNYNPDFDVVKWMKENPGMQTLHTVSAWYWWDND